MPRRWYHWAAVGLAGLLAALLIWEHRAAAALVPDEGTEFGNGQPVTVLLAGGRPRAVYAETDGPRDSVTCRASARRSGDQVTGVPVGEDIVVRDWMAVMTLTAGADATATVSCAGPPDARYRVGADVPPPRPFDGVQRRPEQPRYVLLVAMGAALAVGLAVSPAKSPANRWIYWLWTPILLALVFGVALDRMLYGVVAGVLALIPLMLGAVMRSMGPPWWAWIAGAVAAGLIAAGMIAEGRSAAALAPPSDARFGNHQTMTLQLPAGEGRTVYARFRNTGRGRPRPHADCQALARESGATVVQQPVDGLVNVSNWRAVLTLSAPRAATVDLTCRGGWRYGVGPALPPPRIFDGVERGFNGAGLAMVGLIFVLGGVLVVAVVPLRATVKTGIYRFWAPVLAGAVVTVAMNSLWNGVGLTVLALLAVNGRRAFAPAASAADPGGASPHRG